MTSLELLAPARSADIGIAAIRCGADAVYIGGPAFGARAAAGNSVEEIERLCSFAKAFGVRIFVTVNTLARDDQERRDAVEMMASLKGKGVAAFILQDTSLLELIAARGEWQEEFHASTQCTLLTPQRAAQLAGMGFSRLILERQLSLAQIRSIRSAIPPEVQLEAFVHGALCVSYSGECYLSEHLTGRSANRGECSQPCRSRYDLIDSSSRVIVKDKPLLSLKDLCLLDSLEALSDEGICSFKIEGRLKNESYVKNVVRAYDKALWDLVDKYPDKYCRASKGRCSGGFTPDVNKTFNRGYTALFLDGKRGDFLSGDAAKSMGEQVGKVCGVGLASIDVSLDRQVLRDGGLHNADGLCVTLRGGEVAGFRADRVENLPGGVQRVYCKSIDGLHQGARIWRNLDSAFERSLQNDLPQRVIRQEVALELSNSCATLKCVGADGVTVSLPFPENVETASNAERMRQVFSNQINKMAGNYLFSLAGIECPGPLPFLPAAFLNSLRRTLAEKLCKQPSAPGVKCTLSGSLRPQATPPGGELMRSKYCLRYQMGMCLKNPSAGAPRVEGDLFLRNNGRLLKLRFDCTKCEMAVLSADFQTLSQHSKR